MLTLNNFSVSIESAAIINDISLSFKPSELIVITGVNGGGKSTLAGAIMGFAVYKTQGTIELDGNDMSAWSLEKRAQAGMFLAYQHPIEIPGLPIKTFLQHAYRSCKGVALPLKELDQKIIDAFEAVGLPADFLNRNVHEGFSGGQKKRLELVQMLVLEPRIIIFDEIDSGLDAQGITMLCRVIDTYRIKKPESLIIVITHNSLLADQLNADTRLTMNSGRFI